MNPSKDYSIGKFLEQTLDAFSHFDSKFLRSFKSLLLKPGFLTVEFMRGRRTPYMKPVQIFIVTGILFYFIYPSNATFYAGVKDLTYGSISGVNVKLKLEKKMLADSTSMTQVMTTVNTEAAHRSKAYLFLIIPFWGITFHLLFGKSMPFLVPHIVFATHNVSYLTLLFMAYISVALVLGYSTIGDAQLIPLAVIFAVYIFIAIRRVYGQKIIVSMIKTGFSFAVFLILFVAYRQIITLWALNS
jgi:hypothetical protein